MEKIDQSEFFTLDKANAGIRVPLYTPDGRPTDHWMQIRGVDSDEFRKADAKAKRDAVKLAAITDDREREDALHDLTTRLTASLVIAWSFEQECTMENVTAFFKRAPQICNAIDITAGDRAYFFRIGSSNSADTPGQSSSSTSVQKDQSKPSAPASSKSTKRRASGRNSSTTE